MSSHATSLRTLLNEAMNEPWSQMGFTGILDRMTMAMGKHQWSLAHLILIKAVQPGQRSTFIEHLRKRLLDPLALHMTPALQGKALQDLSAERWTVSPLSNVSYFVALAPHYARLAAMKALGSGDETWAQRRAWLDQSVEHGLALSDQHLARVLVLEAARCPTSEALGWVHEHGLLAEHRAVLLARDNTESMVRRLEPFLGSAELAA